MTDEGLIAVTVPAETAAAVESVQLACRKQAVALSIEVVTQ